MSANAGTEASAVPGSPRSWRRRFLALPSRRRLLIWGVVLALSIGVPTGCIMSMPKRRIDRPLSEIAARARPEVVERVRGHVIELAERIGRRAPQCGERLMRAGEYIRATLEGCGLSVARHPYDLDVEQAVENLEVVLPARRPELPCVVVGAHYDTVPSTPGADDNASGVALLLELAGALAGRSLDRPVRLVAFTCEEPEYFQTAQMGSVRYAAYLKRERVTVRCMISLEMLGYYRDDPGTQEYPFPLSAFYPDRGNFVGVVANLGSRALAKQVAALLIDSSELPVESAALPAWMPGVGWSDHWSFWQEGMPAVMLTDTSLFRNPNYHLPSDTAPTLDYSMMALVADAVAATVERLAQAE